MATFPLREKRQVGMFGFDVGVGAILVAECVELVECPWLNREMSVILEEIWSNRCFFFDCKYCGGFPSE